MHVVFLDTAEGESSQVPGDENEELLVVDMLRMGVLKKKIMNK